jgi:hypothetical protein
MSYHLAYKLGEQLMELVSSIRKPGSPREAASFAKKILEKTGLGEAEITLESREPLKLKAVLKPRKEQMTEVASSMLRGLVAGSLAQALDTPLAIEDQKPLSDGRIEVRIVQAKTRLL